jgi:hypothetical protein
MALAGAPDGLLDWLRSQLPPGAAAAVRRIGAPDLSVFPEEARLITRAGDKRRLEFLAGRAAAREALPAIGHPPAPLLAHPEGDPICYISSNDLRDLFAMLTSFCSSKPQGRQFVLGTV